ncbi:MAG: hypothetical protein GXP39_12250 [Chloroflexi bacterium]|nr:hypothetical protein [Chloroflexota bacterium]
MRGALAAVGFTSTVAQIVLMRELFATFYGNELLFGIVLMAWLAWGAVGAWGLARWVARRWRGIEAFAAGMAFAAVLFPAQIAWVRDVRALLGVTPGAFVEFGPMVAAVILIVAPLCLVTGSLFTLGARWIIERGGSAGRSYAWESIGSVVGGALFSFLFIRWLDPFQTALLVGAVNLTVAMTLLASHLPGLSHPLRRLIPLAVLAVLIVVALSLGPVLHDATLRWQWPDLAFAADSPYGRLIIQARDGQRIFFQNGLLSFETQSTFPEEVIHFPLLAHPNPQSVLLIGGGVAGDLREALKHPIDEAVYVELDPLLIEAARRYLPSEDAAVLEDPRVILALTDGRLYVKTTPRAFDVVILDLPEPSTGTLNRFYTLEFFEEVRRILAPGGIFALGLPSAENYWSPELARRNGSIFWTLRAVFPEVVVLPGEHNFFLASGAPLPTDPGLLVSRLAARGIETRWVTPAYIEYIFTTDRFLQVRRELESTQGVRVNRDLVPICYYYDLALWLSLFYPSLRGIFESAGVVNLGWVIIPLALVVGLARWRRGWAVPIAVAGVGLVEMVLEVVILFTFQVLHGYVYAEISLIVMAFMAGLALGAEAGHRLVLRWRSTEAGERAFRRAFMMTQLAMAVYGGVLLGLLSWMPPVPVLFPLLALWAGGIGGISFPFAVALMRGRASHAVGVLYGADLLGGCLGALLGVVLFVPVLGIPRTCVVIVWIALAGWAALW